MQLRCELARFSSVKPWRLVVLGLAAAFTVSVSVGTDVRSQTVGTPAGSTADDNALGRLLFARHCAGCHGDNGDGQGLAAPYLFPRPRNLQDGKFRLVSTSNNVPSHGDLIEMLRRGMPGSSMPSWDHLEPRELEALTQEIMRIRADGAHRFYSRILQDEEELTDDELMDADVQEEIREFVESVTVPGETTATPEFTIPSPEAVARGREHYSTFGCVSCHGATGRGDGVQAMFDDEQFPTSARDFTLGIFKGGHDGESLFRRIAYGMPGTPMPSSSAMTQDQMVDLVHFIRSLSTEEQRQRVIMRRVPLTAKRYQSLPPLEDPAWDSIQREDLVMVPLWWRDDADPALKVQAAHDGRELAIRLTWSDRTENRRAVSPEEFADMAAVQLSTAGNEPFLGMGTADSPIDLWHWRASSVDLADRDSVMDDYMFESPSYLELMPKSGRPDFVTARAVGNPVASAGPAGASLAAQGLGSTTFRPNASKVIQAEATWKSGHWILVLRRPLRVSSEQGLPLMVDERYAIAFAIWDGALDDRGSQKVVSIWHELLLE